MFLIFVVASALGIYAIAKYATKGGSAGTTGTSGPAMTPEALAMLNAMPWIPIATNKTPKNPDGSGIDAHWKLPVGTEVHFDAQHGNRPLEDSTHVAEIVGIVNAAHVSGSSDPYEVFVVSVASTQQVSEGEKLPQTGDTLSPTPGKIISYKLPGGMKI